jgi:hypothetical protein
MPMNRYAAFIPANAHFDPDADNAAFFEAQRELEVWLHSPQGGVSAGRRTAKRLSARTCRARSIRRVFPVATGTGANGRS